MATSEHDEPLALESFSAQNDYHPSGVTMVFGARGTEKSALARSLSEHVANGQGRVLRVVLGGTRAVWGDAHALHQSGDAHALHQSGDAHALHQSGDAHALHQSGDAHAQPASLVMVDTWDAAQQAIAARETETRVMLIVDGFHSDEPIDRQLWLRNMILNCHAQNNAIMFVYDSPIFLGRLLNVARVCTDHAFVGPFVAHEEGRRLKALLATVHADLNKQTNALLETVSRSSGASHNRTEEIFLHVNMASNDALTRFHWVR